MRLGISIRLLFLVIPLILLIGNSGNNFAQAIPTGSAAQSNLHPDGPFDGAAIVNIPAVTIEACDPESDCFSLLKQIDFSGFPVDPLMTITIHEEFIVGEGSPEWWD